MQNDKFSFFSYLLVFWSMCLLKTSILLVPLRFKDGKWLRVFLYFVMGGVWITHLGAVITLIAQCTPVRAFWTKEGICLAPEVKLYLIKAAVVYCVLTDIICSFLPLLAIRKIKLSMRKRLLVWCLMSIGLIATSFGICRIIVISCERTGDRTWDYAKSGIFANCELFLGIIAANLSLSISMYRYFFSKTDTNAKTNRQGGKGWSTGASTAQSVTLVFDSQLSNSSEEGPRRRRSEIEGGQDMDDMEAKVAAADKSIAAHASTAPTPTAAQNGLGLNPFEDPEEEKPTVTVARAQEIHVRARRLA